MSIVKITMLALCLSLGGRASAQEIFNQVVASAKNIIDDPKASPVLLSIAQFKYTAMQYLCNTAIRRNGGGVDGDFLDRQAYAMNNFLTLFLKDFAQVNPNDQESMKQLVQRYWKASDDNPLFGDEDKETVRAFVNAEGSVTPFSLDTDWEKANTAIEGQ